VTVPFGRRQGVLLRSSCPSDLLQQIIRREGDKKGKVTLARSILLGITERHGSRPTSTAYSRALNKLVTAVRTDLGEPHCPCSSTLRAGHDGAARDRSLEQFFVEIFERRSS